MDDWKDKACRDSCRGLDVTEEHHGGAKFAAKSHDRPCNTDDK